MMEEAGRWAVPSPNHPPYLPDEEECVTAVRMLNDAYAEVREPLRPDQLLT